MADFDALPNVSLWLSVEVPGTPPACLLLPCKPTLALRLVAPTSGLRHVGTFCVVQQGFDLGRRALQFGDWDRHLTFLCTAAGIEPEAMRLRARQWAETTAPATPRRIIQLQSQRPRRDSGPWPKQRPASATGQPAVRRPEQRLVPATPPAPAPEPRPLPKRGRRRRRLSLPAPGTISGRVLAAVVEAGGPVTIAEIADATGLETWQVTSHLGFLAGPDVVNCPAPRVQRIRRGVWRVGQAAA